MIVIITARKGSKRCPGKNAMSFADKSNLVNLTIEQARWMNPHAIWVTSDYSPYELKLDEGTDVFYRSRPEELCTDTATSDSVVEDVLKAAMDCMPRHAVEKFVLMQPTSPIRSKDTLCRAKAIFDKGDIPALVSVNHAYQPTGSFYFCKKEAFCEGGFYPKGAHYYVCSWEESVDINYRYQFRIAEAVHLGDTHAMEWL
jgi:CMP-N-acetylneuraminic acid synthetase